MKIVLQDGIKDCGICCLLSIIRYYGGDVSKEYLRELTNTTKDGVSFYNLIEAAKKIGFEAIGVSGKIENIDVNNLPCIVHVIVNKNYKHFIVLYQINKKKNQVTIMDPSKGKKIISIQEFNLLTSNNYIFLKPIKQLPILRKKNIIKKTIKELIKNNLNIWISIFFITILYFLFNIIVSYHFKYLLEYAINYELTKNIYVINFIIIISYLLKNINSLIRNILLNKWTSIFDEKSMILTYQQILLLPYIYYKNRTTGEIISRFKDLNIIRNFISNLFCSISFDLLSIILFFIILFNYQRKLTIIILLSNIIIIIITFILNKYKKKKIRNIKRYEDNINSYIIQGINNVDTIKGSHLEKRLIDKFKLETRTYTDTIYKYNLIMEIYIYLKNNIEDLLSIIIYSLGSIYIIKKDLELNTFIIYQTFFSYYLNSFYRILSNIEDYSSYKISKERIEELYLIKTDDFKNHYFYLPYNLKGDIIIKDLTIEINGKIILNNINLKIKEGEKILLSGESGSGKSTLVKLLMRYVETDFDKIKINNIDINHYHLENIRSNITYVTSNEYLFNDTLKNNILLYKEKEDIEFDNVCKICLIDEIVKKKNITYNTLIEENGFNYSNGERQRIILARSLLRKSNIYIFDESLGSIDIGKEKKILTDMFKYLNDKTIIVISHRFNNKKLFDRILKIDKGNLYETKKV